MSNIDVALVAGASSLAAAGITALISWLNNNQKNEIDRSHTLFDAYHDVVQNLQSEIERLQKELTLIRGEMKKCESSNANLISEVRKLQKCVERLNETETEIQAALSIEHPHHEHLDEE